MGFDIPLQDLIGLGYTDQDKQQNSLLERGFVKDAELSNAKRQVFYNPKTQQLVENINGTQDWSDVLTDWNLAIGNLENTDRYKDEKNSIEKAKKKYKPKEVAITGSSLGGALATHISEKSDKVSTLNMPTLPFESVKANTTHYRVPGDLVSIANANATHTKTIPKTVKSPWWYVPQSKGNLITFGLEALGSHSSANLKDSGIII
jgi:Lipase (class 3)